MASKKAVSAVLSHLKSGKVLGVAGELSQAGPASRSTALKYKSYNPSLDKADFVNILPEMLFSVAGAARTSGVDFQVLKCRDPRYFQFKDCYVLLFNSSQSLARYRSATELSRINKIRVKFVPLPPGDSSEHVYAQYVKNLTAAFESHGLYNEKSRTKEPFDRSKFDLNALQERIRPIEERSALVWNLPFDMRPHDLIDRFWFYDIKHCFKLYWDVSTGATLYYIAFNDTSDCLKFKRNFHGVHFEDKLHMKLLVETLG
ncbi:hypothetical protein HG536_0A01290 [Torulaspora globosa]|uniref:RNA recognition motif domain-containing protein n=1 Tax=Torulaspora globosa TaxID=48254 RepID=A0A7G3Z9X6_9SACH|nr:uncharacterized protein HG536_0A01290 [Torulaspora globosa]QLL30312.1 hypothetical protein HG536_0A01290 [Torulaspora globosa]